MAQQLPSLPEGYAPGQTRVPAILGITISFSAVASTLVALRLYVRLKLLRSVGKDDWFLIAALVFALVYGSLIVWACNAGLGRHWYDILKEGIDMSNLRYIPILSPLFYNLGQLSIQLSLLTFYLRLSLSKRFNYMTYVLMVIASLNGITCFMVNLIFNLVNTYKYIRQSFPIYIVINSSVNLVLDFAIWCVPLSSIWRLQKLDFRKRLAIIATFSVGLFCCLSGVARSVYLFSPSKTKLDGQWDKVPIQLLCIMEMNLAISGASMAVLKPLLAKLGCIGGSPIISQASNPNNHGPGRGNNLNGRKDMYIEGDDAHSTRGHGRPTDIELGGFDESLGTTSNEALSCLVERVV
ncbi:hypothetical protein EV426DRAFT_193221 [Tirmania nivea]|nr:hypothetical protein EV426DRAFT_193221 [Tirmania nivea]